MRTGIIGGSGLYEMEGLSRVRERRIVTPFGKPSDAYVCGRLDGEEVFFLPRHGRGHRIMPSEINHRANIMGFKMLGVERIIAVTAVGSLKEAIRPGDIVLFDQYFDRTKASYPQTFFGDGIVAHVTFAEPVCADLRRTIARAAREVIRKRTDRKNVRIHDGGTCVVMEGPAFSTKAESEFHRHFGFDVIGMTTLAEAKLCREAEICYQPVAMATDYDCWHKAEESVTVELVLRHLAQNSELAKAIIRKVVPLLGAARRSCPCACSLDKAIVTDRSMIPSRVRKRLKPLINKYL
jgi:5'-methylthioadenosine phosphorylase